MFTENIFNNLEPLSICVLRPSGEVMGCIDDEIDENTASLTVGLNQQYELTFDMTRKAGKFSWYDYVLEGTYLSVDKIGIFKIAEPVDTLDDTKDTKTITAYSCDVELDDKNIQLSLNMGTDVSQEFLVTYDEDETENLINQYTGIPYDWLVLYNTFPEQLKIVAEKYSSGYFGEKDANGDTVITDSDLIEEVKTLCNLIPRIKNKIVETTDDKGLIDYSLVEWVIYGYGEGEDDVTSITFTSEFLDRIDYLISFYTKYRDQLSLLSVVLEKTDGNWTVGDIYGLSDGDYTLANKKYQFETDETIYAFLTNDLAQATNCVVNFDIVNRKVNMTPVEQIGNDTGIVLSYDNLVNDLGIECEEEFLCTRLYVTGADDLDIAQVNFGDYYVDDLGYKLNVRDALGYRIYVSDELAEKYEAYVEFRESLRDEYIQCSKDYNSYTEQIYELRYRVPADSLETDWSTWSLEELEAGLTTYKNLLESLISLYKEDYGDIGLNEDGSVDEKYMRTTMYWWDYVAYKETIINIECAISVYPYYSEEDKWTSDQKAQYKDAISAWETEWTLYGIVELQAKIETYQQNMSLLVDTAVLLKEEGSDEIKTWNELTDDEKALFGYLEVNYYYDAYMEYYNLKQSAQEYLDEMLAEVEELEKAQEEVQQRRLQIISDVSMESYFTVNECIILNRLIREYTYSNENILITSLNNTVDALDVQKELLEDGQEQISILSRPQMQFSVEADNLLGLPEFKGFWDDFVPGNYMMIQLRDNTYVKLRMVAFTFNPCLPSSTDFTIEFSNYIRSKTGLSDIESMLGLAESRGSSSGSSGGGSGGTYGESDDIDVTISNTMLSKLLNSELFGTRVTNVILDTIDANWINAKYATFNGLSQGTTTIDGRCIMTGAIISNNYNAVTRDSDGYIKSYTMNGTEGSIIELSEGTFNFGGGKLTWDGKALNVDGIIKANAGSNIGPWMVTDSAIYNNKSSFTSTSSGVYIGTDGIALGAYSNSNGVNPFSVTSAGVLSATGATISGTLKAGSGSQIGPWTVTDSSIYYGSSSYGNSSGLYFGKSGLSLGSAFKVSASGALTATSADISGTITAGSGSKIGPWTVTDGAIYNSKSSFNSTSSGVYIGTDGISLGAYSNSNSANPFSVTSAGKLHATNGEIGGWTIGDHSLYGGDESNGTVCLVQVPSDLSDSSTYYWVFAAGGYNHSNHSDCLFKVGSKGEVYATRIIIEDPDYSTDTETRYCRIRSSYGSIALRINTSGTKGIMNYDTDQDTWIIAANSSNFVSSRNADDGFRYIAGSTTTDGRGLYYFTTNINGDTYQLGIHGQFGHTGYNTDYSCTLSANSSDIRLKTNIQDSTVEATPIIRAIKIREFDRTDVDFHQKIGFVADELEEIDDNLALGGGYDEEGNMDIKTVNDFYMLGYVVKALQEMDQRISKIEERIEALG